jgi:hypothetical protein
MAVGVSNAGPEGKICTDVALSQGPSALRAVVTIICSRRPLGRRAGTRRGISNVKTVVRHDGLKAVESAIARRSTSVAALR